MIQATQLKPGIVLQKGTEFLKVVTSEFTGTAQSGRTVKLRLKNLVKGNLVDMSFKADEMVQEADLTTDPMEYLYEDGTDLVFMNQKSYEQVSIPASRIAHVRPFLQPNMEVRVQMHNGQPIQVIFPETVIMKVAHTPQGTSQNDSNFKEAELENGMQVLVPQFVKAGDSIVVEVETVKYVDRVKKEK